MREGVEELAKIITNFNNKIFTGLEKISSETDRAVDLIGGDEIDAIDGLDDDELEILQTPLLNLIKLLIEHIDDVENIYYINAHKILKIIVGLSEQQAPDEDEPTYGDLYGLYDILPELDTATKDKIIEYAARNNVMRYLRDAVLGNEVILSPVISPPSPELAPAAGAGAVSAPPPPPNIFRIEIPPSFLEPGPTTAPIPDTFWDPTEYDNFGKRSRASTERNPFRKQKTDNPKPTFKLKPDDDGRGK